MQNYPVYKELIGSLTSICAILVYIIDFIVQLDRDFKKWDLASSACSNNTKSETHFAHIYVQTKIRCSSWKMILRYVKHERNIYNLKHSLGSHLNNYSVHHHVIKGAKIRSRYNQVPHPTQAMQTLVSRKKHYSIYMCIYIYWKLFLIPLCM